MKGNIVKELRWVVKTLYSEGHDEIFGLSIVKSKNGIKIQTVDFYLEPSDLDSARYSKTYSMAKRAMNLVSARCKNVSAVSIMICSEVSETMFIEGSVLRVFNLNVDYIPMGRVVSGGLEKNLVTVG